jgi:hypothetical protein
MFPLVAWTFSLFQYEAKSVYSGVTVTPGVALVKRSDTPFVSSTRFPDPQ